MVNSKYGEEVIKDRQSQTSQAGTRSLPNGDIETDVLIVGAGPAGVTLACCLAQHGLTGIMINNAAGTADLPRGHLLNLSAQDTFRDLGIIDHFYKLGRRGVHIEHYRWCETLAEEEYARIYSWANDPRRAGDYAAASPNTTDLDLPQSEFEPLLLKFATTKGFKVMQNTQFVSLATDASSKKPVALVKDLVRGTSYHITCKYLSVQMVAAVQ